MVDPETAETWRTVGALARLWRLQDDPELHERLVREERLREIEARAAMATRRVLRLPLFDDRRTDR